MSCFGFTIGSLADQGDLVQDIISELHTLRLSDTHIFSPDWTACASNIVPYHESLNIASLSLFLDHVAHLEGYEDTSAAMNHTRFKHLPYQLTTIWLPIEFANSPVMYAHSDPIALASAPGLVQNLEEIRRLSAQPLGRAPLSYGNDGGVTDGSDDPELECLQWLWYDLYQMADKSIKLGAPAWGSSA